MLANPRRLFHVSEEEGVVVFEPRPAPSGPDIGPVVWAIAESHLVNYLLPRECPRITFAASEDTSTADLDRFGIVRGRRVVIVERTWWHRVRTSTLQLYDLPGNTFVLHDHDAGYWISRQPVRPFGVTEIRDLPQAIRARGAELQVIERLWDIHDAVAASTLSYSIIRMRNAASDLRERTD